MKIVSGYTREAGVRSLERSVGAVVRAKAVEWAEYVDDQSSASSGSSSAPSSGNANEKTHDRKKPYNPLVEERDLEKILGVPRWDGDEREREERRGVVYGLVVTGMGEGSIMPVETIALPGSGKLKLTGSLGDVSFAFTFRCIQFLTHIYAGHQRVRRTRFELGQNARVRDASNESAEPGSA